MIGSARSALKDDEIAKIEALRAGAEQIEVRYADADEMPGEITERLDDKTGPLRVLHRKSNLIGYADKGYTENQLHLSSYLVFCVASFG